MKIMEYKRPILKKGDYMEITKKEFQEKGFPINHLPDTPDTEDGKYVLLNLNGMFKTMSFKNICNDLWLFFIDGIETHMEHQKFTRLPSYIECLLKIRADPKFKKFVRIIKIGLDNPLLIFKHKYNLKEFIELCNLYGEIYGIYDNEIEMDKPLDHYVDLFFAIESQLLDINKMEII